MVFTHTCKYIYLLTFISQVWETLKHKEPREVLTMIPNEKGFDLSNTEATGSNQTNNTAIRAFLIRPMIQQSERF